MDIFKLLLRIRSKLHIIKLRKRYRLAQIGQSIIYPTSQIITPNGKGLFIGDECRIGCYKKDYLIGSWSRTRLILRNDKSQLKIGDRTRIFGANICSLESISIGRDCQIACGVQIMDYNAHQIYLIPRGDKKQDTPNPVIIGDNVWIGLNAIILKGSIIGDHSIIGAGSVVKGEFPPYSMIVGNPAKLVKLLDSSKFIIQS